MLFTRLLTLNFALFLSLNALAASAEKKAQGPVATKTAQRAPASIIPFAPIEEKKFAKTDSLKEFLRLNYPSTWQIERAPSGEVVQLKGGVVPRSGQDLQSSYHWILLLSDYLGFDPLLINPAQARVSYEGTVRYFHFDQIWDGYPVYGAELKVHSRESDSALLGFENHLRTDLKTYAPIQKGAQEAQSQLREELSTRRPKFEDGVPTIVIWPSSDLKEAELAWKFRAYLHGPDESVEIFYGGNSGKLLKIDQVSKR